MSATATGCIPLIKSVGGSESQATKRDIATSIPATFREALNLLGTNAQSSAPGSICAVVPCTKRWPGRKPSWRISGCHQRPNAVSVTNATMGCNVTETTEEVLHKPKTCSQHAHCEEILKNLHVVTNSDHRWVEFQSSVGRRINKQQTQKPHRRHHMLKGLQGTAGAYRRSWACRSAILVPDSGKLWKRLPRDVPRQPQKEPHPEAQLARLPEQRRSTHVVDTALVLQKPRWPWRARCMERRLRYAVRHAKV